MSLPDAKFPDNWNIVPIDSVVFYQEGPGVRKHQYTDAGVKLLNGGNINNGVLNLDSTDRYVTEEEAYGKYSHFLVDEGDLLIACSGIVVDKFDGKIAYARKEHLPLCMNTSTMRFRALDSSVLDIDYFRRFLQTNFFKRQLQKLITGSAQLNFGPSHIKQMEIPLPPLSEQKRIAAILDKADAIRRKRQQAIQLADNFLSAVFLDMFGDPVTNPKGWDRVTLGELIHFAKDGPHVSPKYSDEGIPFLSTRHIKPSSVVWEDLKHVTIEEANMHWKKCKPELGDVLYTKGGTTGIACPVDFEKDFAVWVHVALLRPRAERVNYIWLAHMLNSKYCYQQSQRHTRGATNKDLGLTRMKDIEMYCPPIKDQMKFVGIKSKIEELINREIDFNGKSLFESLSQDAFQGTL